MKNYPLNSNISHQMSTILSSDLQSSFERYFDASSKRYPISSRKNSLRAMLSRYMSSLQLERFEHDGVHMDYLPRTITRIDSTLIPVEIKETSRVTVKTVQLVPFDLCTSAYLLGIGSSASPDCDEEEIEDDEEAETSMYSIEEIVKLAKEFNHLKGQFKHYDDICKAHKKKIMDYMNSHGLDELCHDGNKLRLMCRVCKRFSPKKLSLDELELYTRKVESRLFNVYLLDDIKAIEEREIADGTAELRRIKSLRTPLDLIRLDESPVKKPRKTRKL